MKIVFVTSNAHKFREVRGIVRRVSPNIEISHLPLRYPEIQHEDTEFVARSAAYFIRKECMVNDHFFIEDSGLFIPALNGFPGAFSSFVFSKIGNEGILKLMEWFKGDERRAFFKSVIAFSPLPRSSRSDRLDRSSRASHEHSSDAGARTHDSHAKSDGMRERAGGGEVCDSEEREEREVMIFVGITEGRIAERVRGSGGFGFDPIFEYEGKTFAEMTTDEKNRASHRGKAVRKFLDYLLSHF